MEWNIETKAGHARKLETKGEIRQRRREEKASVLTLIEGGKLDAQKMEGKTEKEKKREGVTKGGEKKVMLRTIRKININ